MTLELTRLVAGRLHLLGPRLAGEDVPILIPLPANGPRAQAGVVHVTFVTHAVDRRTQRFLLPVGGISGKFLVKTGGL